MGRINRLLAAALLGPAFTAAAVAAPAPLAAQEAPPPRPAASWSHDRSGLVLPASIAGFERGESKQFDAEGYNVGVTLRDAASGSTATLFVYRAAPASVPIWGDRAVAAMFANPALGQVDVNAVRFARFTPPGGAGDRSGLRVVAPLSGGMSATGLALYLHDGWLVKLRMTSQSLDAPGLEARMRDLVAALAFPAAAKPAPPFADIADCAAPMTPGKPAKLVKLDTMGALMIGAMLSAAREEKLKAITQGPGAASEPAWCRDPSSEARFGIYRREGADDTYLVALGDTGTSLSVGPFDAAGLIKPGRRFVVTQSDGVTEKVYPPFDRLPLPGQVLGLPGQVATIFSAGLLEENKGAAIVVPAN